MPRRHLLRGSTNPELIRLIRTLIKRSRENKVSIWRDVADRLAGGDRVVVNISRINRNTGEGETVIVPGKVLGTGRLDHPIKVAAFNFSKSAMGKITSAGGSCMTIEQLVSENPKGSLLKVMC